MTARYAIYWTPDPEGPLAAFGAAWLGRDPVRASDVPRLAAPGIAADCLSAATASPRRYGLHATLKPPFMLAPDANAGALEARLARFAASRPAIEAPPVVLADLKGFLALVTSERCEGIHALADATVEAFDDLRAPPPPEETARRRTAGLSQRQEAHLQRWGYPYVFEDFTFHVTLTERLPEAERARFRSALAPLVAPFCGRTWRLDAVSLLVQPGAGEDFVVVRRFALGGAA